MTDLCPVLPYDAPVDLHLHTLASDGFWTPGTLIDHLAANGFRVAAVCDHDSQASVLEAIRLGAERGITVIPGVEVTCRWNDRQWHLLVYGISPDRTDDDAKPFQALLARIQADLAAKGEDARQRIEASGRPLPSFEEVRAGRPLTPFHTLSAAIRDVPLPGLKEAAELVVELGGSFSADLPFAEVIDAAHQAGGICVMAHPGRADAVGIMTEDDLERIMAESPIDGLEAHYRSYTDSQTELYRRLATDRGMLMSTGSDSHAPGKPVDPRPWRAAWCRDLLGRLGIAVEPTPDGPDWAPGMDPMAVVPAPVEIPTSAPEESPGEQLMEVEAELEATGKVEGGS